MYPMVYFAGHSISSYAFMFIVGWIVMLVINILRRNKMEYSVLKAAGNTVLVTLIACVGAKLLFIAENWRDTLQNGVSLSGVSFFGAMFSIPAGVYLIKKIRNQDYGNFMDYVSPALITFLALVRVGCYLSGCCGGITYIRDDLVEVVVPTQMIECVADLVIMVVLLLLEWQFEGKGILYPFLMVMYGCMRFIVEFFRDTSKDWLCLSHGQWFALACILIGGILLYRLMPPILAEMKRQRYSSHKKRH